FRNTGTILSPPGGTNYFSVYNGDFKNSGTFQADTNAIFPLYISNGSFEEGTRFDGSGTIKLHHDSNVSCHGNMFVNGRLIFDGIISGTNTWHGPGIFDWTEGKFSYGSMTLASNLQVNAVGPLLQLGDQAYLTNDSVFHWLGGVFSSFYSVINVFENRGVMVPDKEASLFSTVFRNTGTILSPPGGTNYFSVYNGDFKNSGTFQADTNAIFPLYISNGSFEEGTRFDGSGTIKLVHESHVRYRGNIFVNGRFSFDGAISGTNTWNGPGFLDCDSGATFTDGYFALASDLHLNALFLQLSGDAHLTNYTSLEVQTVQVVDGYAFGCSIDNRGMLVLKTNCTFSGGHLKNLGTLVISGISTPGYLGMWSLNNYGTLIVAEGVSQFSGLFQTFSNYGTLELRGGSLVFDGTPLFAYPINQPLLGNCQFVLGAGYPEVPSPQIQFQGFPTVAFNGTITVTPTNNISITNGSTFTLVTTDIGFSSFPPNSDVHLPILTNNLDWRVLPGANFTLRAVSPVAPTNVARLTNGVFQFTISGGAGSACIVEASTNLADWLVIQTNSPYTGNFNLVDMGATNLARRFYRFHIDD
ncbi:MAG: hypothetical protein JWM68_4021, partial [Verrucomicrobiales bacterium]|nr:hypothetical protein [Verrucomicrobiales bacterium]